MKTATDEIDKQMNLHKSTLILMILAFIMACSNPLSERENVVRVLLEGPVASGE